MPNRITLTLDLTVEEAIGVLQALQKTPKKEITQWPYWCWNCKGKIEEKPELMVCPHCGVVIPEP